MSKPEPIDTYYYVDEHTDEVLPCSARLAAWAEWLSKPDEDWPHDIPKDGETFGVSTLLVLGNVEVSWSEDGIVVPELPEGTDQVFVRYDDETSGWDAEASTAFALNASEEVKRKDVRGLVDGFWLQGPGDTAWIACVADGPRLLATYRAGPPPSLAVGAKAQ